MSAPATVHAAPQAGLQIAPRAGREAAPAGREAAPAEARGTPRRDDDAFERVLRRSLEGRAERTGEDAGDARRPAIEDARPDDDPRRDTIEAEGSGFDGALQAAASMITPPREVVINDAAAPGDMEGAGDAPEQAAAPVSGEPGPPAMASADDVMGGGDPARSGGDARDEGHQEPPRRAAQSAESYANESSAIGSSAIGSSTVGSSTVGSSAVGSSAVGSSAIESSAVGSSALESSAVESSAADVATQAGASSESGAPRPARATASGAPDAAIAAEPVAPAPPDAAAPVPTAAPSLPAAAPTADPSTTMTPAVPTAPPPEARAAPAEPAAPVVLSRAEDLATAIERLRPIPTGGAMLEVEAPGLGAIRLHVAREGELLRIRIHAGSEALAWFAREHDGLCSAARQAVPEAAAIDLQLECGEQGRHEHGADAQTQRRAETDALRHPRRPAAPASPSPSPVVGTAARGLVDVIA